jgi:YcaO-like protein with predicted kinase domain
MHIPQATSDRTLAKLLCPGTHRSRPPAQTVALMRPFLPEMGITRVANVTGMDHLGIPTVMVVRPNARSLSVSQGKGADLDAARASGIMEAVEQWHAERIDRPLRLAAAEDLGGELAPLDRLPRSVRELTPDLRLPWIEARDLATGRAVLVPHELVNLDLRLPLPEGSGCFLGGSNGLASGNDLGEATIHGLCEVIERDALTLFFLRAPAEQWARRLDLDSVADETCRELLARYRAAEVEVAIWDATSDVGLPCFLCSALDRAPDPFRPLGLARGAGCHPDARVALARALTEAAQSRLTRIVGTRDDIQRRDFEQLRSDDHQARHRAQMATPVRPPRRLDQVPGQTLPTFADDLDWARARLAAAGIDQVLVVDLSRERYPVRVVRVIVPGLEGLSDVPGYHPGPRARRLQAERGS